MKHDLVILMDNLTIFSAHHNFGDREAGYDDSFDNACRNCGIRQSEVDLSEPCFPDREKVGMFRH